MLCDPISEKIYTVANYWRGKEWKFFDNAIVCASKFGWLLLAQKSLHKHSCFLYSPFTRDVIKLPELSSKHVVATISSAPTSPGCVVFVASLLSGNKLRISTCRCGDKAWSTQEFDGEFEKPQKSVVYVEGAFYCVFKGGMLGFFTVEDGSWSLLATSLDPFPWWHEFDMDRDYLVECEGKLLMATLDETLDEWRIFRFDWSEMSWVLQERLGEWALFAGGTSFLVPAVEGREYLAKKIYYNICGCGMIEVYSLDDGLLYEEPDELYDRLERQCGRIESTVWIQPPC